MPVPEEADVPAPSLQSRVFAAVERPFLARLTQVPLDDHLPVEHDPYVVAD